MSDIVLRKFTEADIAPATVIMKAAFDEDSDLFRTVPDAPEGYDDGSFLRKFAVESGADSVCVLLDGVLAGAVIVFHNAETNENFLGCIFLDPSLRGRGLGKEVWDLVEARYPDVKIWRTETPLCSRRNLNFYINKLGFMAYQIDDPKEYESALVQLVKFR